MIYGLFFDWGYWKIFFTNLIIYFIFVMVTRSGKENPKRKTLMIASWNESSNPTSFIIEDLNVTKAMEFISKLN